LLEGKGGSAEGEVIQLSVKVGEGTGRPCRSGARRSWPSGRIGTPWGSTSGCRSGWKSKKGLFVVGNTQEIVEGTSAGLSGTGTVTKGGILNTGTGTLLLLLEAGKVVGFLCPYINLFLLWSLRSSLTNSGRVWDLSFGELDDRGCPEPITGIDGVFPLEIVFIFGWGESIGLFLSGVTGKSTDVGELSLFAIGINVTVLSASDAVHAPRLFSELAVFADVAEGEAAIVVGVGVPLGGVDGLFPWRVGDPLSLLFVVSGVQRGTIVVTLPGPWPPDLSPQGDDGFFFNDIL
jgi:hypothetical protein